ncbi:SulP family inorganic anion transporter [bacterium]|nr:SulP family inorganic anion transporter [bacterium]
MASIVVFLVALPLSMGIAIASGIPMERASSVGILTAVIGGLVVGPLAGCPLQVSGPAAGLAVMVAALIERFGFETLGLIVLIAGLLQILAGALRVAQIFRAVAPSLIQGMLAGIGILILVSQFHVMVDDRPPGTGKEFGGLINLATIPSAVWKGFMVAEHQHATHIGLLTIVIVILWAKFSPQRLTIIPAPLVGVTVSSIVANRIDTSQNFLLVPDNLGYALNPLSFSDVGGALSMPILLAALSLAFVASAESLLTATAVDSMQTHTARTNYNREMMAQGTGNILCGFLGLLPITGVIVRSSANVQAGARTRVSTVLHGAWMVMFFLAFPNVVRLIPVSSLAAILVYTGFKLINVSHVRKFATLGKGELTVYFCTLATVVAVDLLTGIVAGLVVGLVRLMKTFTHLAIHQDHRTDGMTVLRLKGAATFIRLPALAAALEGMPPGPLQVDLEGVTFMDHACFELLVNWERQHKAQGADLTLDWNALSIGTDHPAMKRMVEMVQV